MKDNKHPQQQTKLNQKWRNLQTPQLTSANNHQFQNLANRLEKTTFTQQDDT
jgi:cell division protein FtsL